MQDFRTLKVWEKAHAFTLVIHEVSLKFPDYEKFGLSNTIRKCMIQIPASIAQACGSFDGQDYGWHFQAALKQAYQLEYLLLLARDLKYIPAEIYAELEPRVVEIKKMLTVYIQKVRSGNS